jgi:hypothetical protein
MCRTPGIFKPVLFVALLSPELVKADANFNNCMKRYQALCDETALSTEQVDQLNQKRSADMLKKCQLSSLLCNKEVLLPADLEKID